MLMYSFDAVIEGLIVSVTRAFPGPLGVPAPIMQLIAVVICGNEYLNDICLDTLNLIDGADNPNFNRVSTVHHCVIITYNMCQQ